MSTVGDPDIPAAEANPTPALTGEQLAELLALLPDVDSVELKLSVPDANRRAVIRSLQLDPLDAEIRQVMFFDTPDLTLNAQGLVVRARRIQRKAGDTVVKLRPVVPSSLPPRLRQAPGFGVEVDAMPGGFVCSARMKAEVTDDVLVQSMRGSRPIRKLFTKPQRRLFADHAAGLTLDDLQILGPITILKLKFAPKEHPRPMVAELWFYPDGSQILELSSKCLPSEAFQATAEARVFLASKGVDLGAPQQTKTKAALAFFAAELDATQVMTDVVARWEWRTFGESFDDLERRVGPLTLERVMESDETYLLCSSGSGAAKIRDDLMDVKQLLRVNEDGLEQWTVAMKAPFPLSAADVDAVLSALQAEPVAHGRASYSLPELLDEVVSRQADLRAVDVHKRRERYTIGGCISEVTEVRAAGVTSRTIAIESEDPAQVIAAVRRTGLASRPNVSFARGLKTLARFGQEPYAVIDVGTNSVKFHVGQRGSDGSWQTVADRAAVTRLGEGLEQSGRLNPEPIARTVEAIAEMVQEARERRVAGIAMVGTAGLRMASNGPDVATTVRERCSVDLEIISGEEESRLAFLAATASLGTSDGVQVVFDTGGGSSQFTFGRGDQIEERFSVDVGAVRFTERHHLDGPVDEDVLAAARRDMAADLSRLDDRPATASVIAMGGAITNLAAVKHALADYDAEVVQGTVLDRDEIDRQIEEYRTRSADERRSIVGLQPARAEVILAGALIVRTVLDKLGADSLTVSDRGLRHGVLVERFG